MTNIVLLFLCLLAGIALRVSRRVPENSHAGLNGIITHLALPALILGHVHGSRISADMMWPVLMPWIVFGLSAALFAVAAHGLRLSRETAGALILSAGLANTSFIGLPMIESFYGRQGLSTGIMIDQLGTYMVLSTVGLLVAGFCSRDGGRGGSVLTRILTFPPLIALVLAVILSSLEYPPWLSALLARLGDMLAPLAMVSVGLQLKLADVAGNRGSLGMGLAFKLLLAPLAVALLYVALLNHHDDQTRITVFEAAMGPQIGGAIVAIQHGLNPPLVSLMVGIGITLSFLTLPLWWWVLAAI